MSDTGEEIREEWKRVFESIGKTEASKRVINDFVAERAKWWSEAPARRARAELERRMKAMG